MNYFRKYKEYFYSLKQFIIISLALFIFSIIYGYFGAQASPEEAKTALLEFEKIFQPILEATPFVQFILIFLNNAFSLFLSIALGIFFGIFPVLSIFSNGTIIGAFIFLWQQEFSISIFLISIIPHGIIEIPLLIIGSAIGLKIGKTVIDKVFKKKGEIKKEIKIGLDFFVKIMLILILLAAAIEVFLTPLFL